MEDWHPMQAADVARALNEWMRRYIENPEAFSREFQTVADFVSDQLNGRTPSYGESGAAYMFKLLDELKGNTQAA